MQVYDRNGRLITIAGDVVPDGCSVKASVLLMDSAEHSEINELRQRHGQPPLEDEGDDQGDDQGDELTDAEQAYLRMKTRLDTAAVARRQPKPEGTWAKGWSKPKKRKIVLAGDADPIERARLAYQQRSRDMADSWKKSRGAGPWGALPTERPIGQPAWTRLDGTTPSVGPGSRSPYRSANMSDGEQAYRRMVDSLSNRWRTHRRPAVPEVN